MRDFQLWPVVVFGGWLSDKLAEHHWMKTKTKTAAQSDAPATRSTCR